MGENIKTALMEAAEQGDIKRVRALLKKGLSGIIYRLFNSRRNLFGNKVNAVDNEGNSALHKAALNGHSECVRALLEAGADPKYQR